MSDVDAKPLAISSIPYALALSPSLRALRSNPSIPVWRDGLLRCARNDGMLNIFIVVAVAVAGWHLASAAWRARSLHSTPRCLRYDWRAPAPARRRGRRFLPRSGRDAP